jgi:hypothetical protein
MEVPHNKMEDPNKVRDDGKVQEDEQDIEHQHVYSETSSLGKDDILQLEHTDPVLNAKMHLVNNAIDEVGLPGKHVDRVTDWVFADRVYNVSMEGTQCVSNTLPHL